MEITQKLSSTQEGRQEQTRSRQQIQALEMLSMPVMEIQSMVTRELESNPLLETGPEDKNPQDDSDEWLDKILKLDEESRYVNSFKFGFTEEDEERRRHFLESVVAEDTLHDRLMNQIRYLDVPQPVKNACEAVASSLDDDGYLRAHPADIAMGAALSMDAVAKAVELVKTLDPSGVGAANLQERILIQLERLGEAESDAYAIVRDHLDALAANQLPAVAKAAGMSIERIKKALRRIQELSPRLGQEAECSPADIAREEVVVEEIDGEFRARIRNECLPSLRISPQYRKLLEDPGTPQDARDYVKEKIKAGVIFINSIIQRQTTIRKIMEAVLKRQQDYFRHGPAKLKPMTMVDVAEIADVHDSTVSRAVAGKFMRCAHGLVPMRDLFSGGYQSETGEDMSRNVVMDIMRRIVATEDAAHPLSDVDISKLLKEKGLDVARRTVAKYRDMLGILPSNLRREY